MICFRNQVSLYFIIFSSNCFYSAENNANLRTVKQELPSLRKTIVKDDFNLFKITPEFRNHVAKHLSHLLDEKVNNFISTDCNSVKKQETQETKGGIKLFNSSNEFIKLNEPEPLHPIKKKMKVVEKDQMEKLKDVAITMKDIEKEVKYWSNRSKAPIFKYKQNKNGILEQIQ